MKDPRETEVRDVVGKDGRDGGWQLQVLLTAKSRYTLSPPRHLWLVVCLIGFVVWLIGWLCVRVRVCVYVCGKGGYGGGGVGLCDAIFIRS